MPQLPGPRGPIRFERDAWGYPCLHARTRDEAAYALGYLHATDRLVQAHLTCLAGEGRLMEVLGDEPFARRVDRSVRALRLADDLTEAVARFSPELRAWVDTYCRGFRAGAAARGRPLALRALGLPVRPWRPEDVVLCFRTLSWFGMTSTTQLARLAVCELAAGGASESALRLLVGDEVDLLDRDALRGTRWQSEDALLGTPGLGGSNAFVIGGDRTQSGGALMLSEFHLEIGRIPPVTYAVDIRLDDGGYLLGMTAPGIPYLLTGRNPRAGWTYTFGHADNMEVRLHDVAQGRTRWEGRTVDLRPRTEVAHVKGRADDVRLTFYDLPDGGVLLGSPHGAPSRAPSVLWRGGRDTPADHQVLFEAMSASTVDELVAIHRSSRILSTACLFGDREGRVAWMHGGRIRADRRVRIVETPDVDAGQDARPVDLAAEGGFVASANEAVPGWTAFAEPRYRRQRLAQLLAEGDDWDVARAGAVTHDPHDGCAERMMAVWSPLLPDVPRARALAAWARGQGTVGEPMADRYRRHFHARHTEVCRALLAERLDRAVARQLMDDLGLLLAFHDSLDEVLALQTDLLDAEGLRVLLARAWPRSLGTPGPAVEGVVFRDVLTEGKLPAWMGFHRGPIRHPGSPTTLFQLRRLGFLGHELFGGPAFHLVMDLGRDGGWYDHPGGASEQRFGPGYGAGLEAWAEGRRAPLGPVTAPDR
jgi:penicillin amidase